MSAAREVDLAKRFIHQVQNDPVWFAREVLNHKALPGEPTIAEDPSRSWELDTFQCEILEAVADVWRKQQGEATRVNHEGKNYITIRSGHGPGKTHTAALVAFTLLTAFKCRVVCTAPKLQQLRTRVWSALRKIDARAESWWRGLHVIHDTTVYGRGPDGKEDKTWCILAETATHPDNIAGHHERVQLIIVEEASGVSEALFPVVFGALSTGGIQILLMISNPTRSTGTFANSHLQAREAPNYFRYHINLKNARRIDRDWVSKMERKYGKDSPVVLVRCHGEFAKDSPNQLFALDWLSAQRGFEGDPIKGDGSIPRLRVSVDCAAGGVDETVCAVARHFETFSLGLKMTRHNFPLALATVQTADAAEKLFFNYGGVKGADDFVVDSLGVGVGVAGTLLARGHKVVTYQGGASSSDPSRWRNRRVQTHLVARNHLRDRTSWFLESFLDGDDWDEFDAQMCSIRISPNTDRVEDLVTKEQMKDEGIPSPDMAECWVMQYATQTPTFLTQTIAQENGAELPDPIYVTHTPERAW